jgi:hypothetical protein
LKGLPGHSIAKRRHNYLNITNVNYLGKKKGKAFPVTGSGGP